MDAFMIKYNTILKYQDHFQDYVKAVKNFEDEVDRIKRDLRWKISSYDQIEKRLSKIANQMESDYGKLNTMGNALSDISKIYLQTEKSIIGENTSSLEDADSDMGDKIKNYLLSLAGDCLSNLGVLGPGVSTVVSWFDEENRDQIGEVIVDLGSAIVKTAQNVATGLDENDDIWQWLGCQVEEYGDDFLDNLDDSINDQISFMNKSGATKWLGALSGLFTVATTGVDNYYEYKSGEISVERAITETGVETLVSGSMSVAATALVTSGLAAIGIAGAPAVAVGALATCAVWAVDVLSKEFTGKGATELISDTIIDVGERIGDFARSPGETSVGWFESFA